MWIGTPGNLRQIKDGATSYDRSPDVSAVEFKALSGGITTWVPPIQPRRLKMSWEAMGPRDADYIDRLARHIDGIGPLVILDPLSRNMLSGAQAAGLGSHSMWVPDTEITLYGGTVSEWSPVTVNMHTAGSSVDLQWRHAKFHGVPVQPEITYTWWAPGLLASDSSISQLRVYWYTAANSLITTSSTTNPAVPFVLSAPAGACYVRPGARFGSVGTWLLGESVFAEGDLSADLLSGARPPGDGMPSYSVTGYTHRASAGNGFYRDITLDLVEVTSSATG